MNDDADQGFRLQWKREPSEPCEYSDWTLEVFSPEVEGATMDMDDVSRPGPPVRSRYAVHRNMLGFGSLYFNRVFAERNKDFCEGTKRACEIELPPHAKEAFEDMLDFFYSLENKLTIGTSNAVGLYFLCDYLQIRTLRKRVESFIDCDMGVSTCALYFQQAKDLHIQCLLDRVALVCCKNPTVLSKGSVLSGIANVDLWRAVMKNQSESQNVPYNWSSFLGSFYFERIWGDCRPSDVSTDKKAFQELTSPEFLPRISSGAAFTLLSVEKVMQLDKCEYVARQAKLTNLQERCVASLNDSWNKQHMDSIAGKLRGYSPDVLESLLISSVNKQLKLKSENTALSVAKVKLEVRNIALSATTAKLNRENRALSATKAQLNDAIQRLGPSDFHMAAPHQGPYAPMAAPQQGPYAPMAAPQQGHLFWHQ